MNYKVRIFALTFLLVALTGGAFAKGAGGILMGMVKPEWNPDFMPGVPSSLPDFEYMGGYGYGVARDGAIIGGFGLAFLDYAIYDRENWGETSRTPRHIAGGAGGIVLGSRITGSRMAHLDIAARLGLGGMGLATRRSDYAYNGTVLYKYEAKGYAVVYAEPYAELGLGLSPWMQLSATLSYPFIGNLAPGKPFGDVRYYTPTVGVTVTFGAF
jgi:hypothetical protein